MTETSGSVFFFKYTGVNTKPVCYWYSGRNYRRYFFGYRPFLPQFIRCNAVVSLFLLWNIWITRVIRREHSFGTGIAYWTIYSRFPIFWVLFPWIIREQLGNKFGTCGFRRKSPSLDKAAKMRDSVRLNSLESFLVTLPFNLSKNLGVLLYSHFWIKCVLRQTVSCIFTCFSQNCRHFLPIPRNCHDSEGKVLSVLKTGLIIHSITKAIVSFYEGKFQRDQTVNDINKKVWYQRLQNYVTIVVLSFLIIILSHWRET